MFFFLLLLFFLCFSVAADTSSTAENSGGTESKDSGSGRGRKISTLCRCDVREEGVGGGFADA